MNVLLTGASGFIGSRVRVHLERRGHRVRAVSRRPGADHDWSDESLARGVAATDAVLHLAGENLLAGRWNDRRKEELRMSRLETTAKLVRHLAKKSDGVLVSASAIGYYGARGDESVGEDERNGSDFLAHLCRDWEAAARTAEASGTRVAMARIGIVLGPEGGALAKMLLPFRLGVGGPVGSGEQVYSWIHVEDLCALFAFLLEHAETRGPFNGTAPNPVRQREFARVLGRVLSRPAFMPLPGFVLRIALGEAADVLLTGVRALPRHALDAGFVYQHPDLERALRDLLQPRSKP